MDETQQDRAKVVMDAADALAQKVLGLAAATTSAGEIKQLTSALRELKDIQGLSGPGADGIRVELEPEAEGFAG